MGGNALQRVWLKRMTPDIYFKLKKYILTIMKESNIECDVPRELPNKDSFGDIDIIYYTKDIIDIRQFIEHNFKPSEMVKNGDVISFDMNVEGMNEFKNFQIDFIKVHPDSFNFAQFYFSYGDLGSIIGRISNAFGIKFGIDGVWVNIEPISGSFEHTVISDKIMLTNNPREFCKFFDLNYDRWDEGFSNITDIFKWIVKTNYFNKDIFMILNHAHRVRMEKRKMYQEFLKYIGVDFWKITNADAKHSEIIHGIQSLAIDYFNKNDVISELKMKKLEIKERNRKFNGNKFIKNGITGKEIGIMITKIQNYIEGMNKETTFEQWITNTSEEDIDKFIEIFCKTHSK